MGRLILLWVSMWVLSVCGVLNRRMQSGKLHANGLSVMSSFTAEGRI